MRRWFASTLVLAALLAPLPGTGEEAASDALAQIETAVDSQLLHEARELLDALPPASAVQPRARYLSGKLLFYEGRFDESLVELRAAIEGARAELGWKLLRDQVELTRQTVAGLTTTDGASGAFVYRHAAGVDQLLVGYADRALTAQLDALDETFGDRPRVRVQVDLMPDVESLAAASGLTVEQIERTGTVGVTKHGRIMVLTPRELTAGYPWLDTLAHELTHVTVTRLTRDRAPIWLHEGVAKLQELRWRGSPTGQLSPTEAYLLDRAARERRLIPLRRFHPSVAHLPNQEDAALAYAQVLSFLTYLDQRLDDGWIRSLLTGIGSGQTVDQAFVEVTRFPLRRHYMWWRQAASGKRQTPASAVGFMERRYERGAATAQTGLESVLSLDVRRHLRVGDLLRLRGHVKAAAAEFRQALALADSPSPAITDRLAGCLIDLSDYQGVVELLADMVRLYPSHAEAFIQLGRAYAALGQPEQAATALERANAVNPFHPAVHCVLAEQYRSLERPREAATEAANCRLIASRPGPNTADGGSAVD
jgi:tetratricopeptide (TPR) repeat protein